MKFRKKPIVIEAVQLRWDTWDEMCKHADVGSLSDGKPEGCYVDGDGHVTEDANCPPNRMGLAIPTLEGLMIATQNDWIIRGVEGELYPCKDSIFRQTYEEVVDA